ncbi:MAG: hypothetical protein L3J31_05785 [Bacteroidales bacterium]|nr:hypothetical protein [Bacteroidales bacterium]MCF6342300.1 hypothetical protein [Bacteroidales bacterium]
MAEYLFQGGYLNKSGTVAVKSLLVHFKDENNIHFIDYTLKKKMISYPRYVIIIL